MTTISACFTDPPASIGGANKVNFSSIAKGFVGEELRYACPEGKATVDGLFYTEIVCNTSAHWTDFDDPDFECLDGRINNLLINLSFLYQILYSMSWSSPKTSNISGKSELQFHKRFH